MQWCLMCGAEIYPPDESRQTHADSNFCAITLNASMGHYRALAEVAAAERDELRKRIEKLDDLVRIQCHDGNWNYDPYMHGMANGLLVAQAAMYNSEHFEALSAPATWLKDEVERQFPEANDGSEPPLHGNRIKYAPEGRCVLCDDHLFTATWPRSVYAGTNPDGSGRLAHPHCWNNMRDQLWLSYGLDLDTLSEKELAARQIAQPKLGAPPVYLVDKGAEAP